MLHVCVVIMEEIVDFSQQHSYFSQSECVCACAYACVSTYVSTCVSMCVSTCVSTRARERVVTLQLILYFHQTAEEARDWTKVLNDFCELEFRTLHDCVT